MSIWTPPPLFQQRRPPKPPILFFKDAPKSQSSPSSSANNRNAVDWRRSFKKKECKMLKNGKMMEEMLVAVVYLLMEERNCWLSQHPLRSLFRRPSCAPIVASIVTPTTEKCCFLYIASFGPKRDGSVGSRGARWRPVRRCDVSLIFQLLLFLRYQPSPYITKTPESQERAASKVFTISIAVSR